MAQFLYHLLHFSMYKIEKSLFHKKYYFYISFWTTLIMFGFWCECPNSIPSDLGHFEGLAFYRIFLSLWSCPRRRWGGKATKTAEKAKLLK